MLVYNNETTTNSLFWCLFDLMFVCLFTYSFIPSLLTPFLLCLWCQNQTSGVHMLSKWSTISSCFAQKNFITLFQQDRRDGLAVGELATLQRTWVWFSVHVEQRTAAFNSSSWGYILRNLRGDSVAQTSKSARTQTYNSYKSLGDII